MNAVYNCIRSTLNYLSFSTFNRTFTASNEQRLLASQQIDLAHSPRLTGDRFWVFLSPSQGARQSAVTKMTLSPELEAACGVSELSTSKLVEILRNNNQCLLSEINHDLENSRANIKVHRSSDDIMTQLKKIKPLTHHDESFWAFGIPFVFSRQFPEFYPLTQMRAVEPTRLPLHDPIISGLKTVREKLITWLCNSHKSGPSIFIIYHPFRSYFSLSEGIVQAVFDICSSIGRFGARVVCYPRPTYGSHFIRSICWQLAVQYLPYRRALMQRLVDDPSVFGRCGFRGLLQYLILEPWDEIAASHSLYASRPPVIFVDGTFFGDSNKAGYHAADLLDYLGERGRLPPSLLWIWVPVTEQPSRSIPAFLSETIRSCDLLNHQSTTVPVGTNEANRYSYLSLRFRFHEVREKHSKIFRGDENWPMDEDLWRLVGVASSHDPFIKMLIRFVDRKESDPRSRLQQCLTSIASSPVPSLDSLNDPMLHFLRQTIGAIPPDLLFHAFRILECLYNDHIGDTLNVLELEHFLEIDRETICLTITHLEWMLNVACEPDPFYPGANGFRDMRRYTLDTSISHALYISQMLYQPLVMKTLLPAATSYLRLLGKPIFQSTVPSPSFEVTFRDDPYTVFERAVSRRNYALRLLEVGYKADRMESMALRHLVANFDFRCLVYMAAQFDAVAVFTFLSWLNHVDESCLVRTEAINQSDELLLGMCQGVATPLDWSISNERIRTPGRAYADKYFYHPKFSLLGHGNSTVLIIMHFVDRIPPAFSDKLVVTIYSHDMLDDM
ncbi:hypothetical protein NP233_g6795 [Leucocoprinus birnbaumii]|uniref:Uncharacterized protein n=1 Tax=Leucocoprinus birnbaumii TaxID=56174 RepID=A0AAD5VTR1_9AGAR|nr:hypothetical protein NP233_g6795 [Leucocoprinus birnbaumii]